MTGNLKHNTKKYIAGILTIALAAGVCQSYGSMEVSAQEMTLPGIEKLVQDTVASSDGTFHILEIVPSKKDASIGYLIGGEEPVSEGRKLSELPAASERKTAMAAISSSSLGDLAGSNGPVSFSAYSEGGSRTEEIRGSFVKNTENSGQYTYTQTEPVYKPYTEGDTRQRYDRYGAIEASGASNENKQSVSPVFSKVSDVTAGNLEMAIGDAVDAPTALAATKYALTPDDKNSDGRMSTIEPIDFVADNYVGREVYTKTDDVYTYLGKVVYGLPAGYAIQSTATTSEDTSGASENLGEATTAENSGLVTAASASGNDAAAESGNGMQTFSVRSTSGNDIETSEQKIMTASDPSSEQNIMTASVPSSEQNNNLYILNSANTTPILWAAWTENPDGTGGSYTLSNPADGYFVHFTENTSGDYYVSKVTLSNTDGDYKLINSYQKNDNGKYVLESSGIMQVHLRNELGYDASNSYDFIGDNAKDALDTVAYDGGFYNKEWFKKQVLNLSGTSRYESVSSSGTGGNIDQLKIEVTTLTVEELAKLVNPEEQAYYGVDLDNVDLIYLSGRGSYAAESVNMTSAATALTKMIFGIKDTTGERNDADRVPVVMDYGFYSQNKTLAEEPNNNQNNKILTQMALTILKVSDDNIAKEVASKGDAYWNGQTAASLSLGDSVKEALYDNVYLNDDSVTPYVASDFLADWKGNAAKAATFEAVLKEIQYENFLAKKNNSNAAQMDEEISKASITRYILNWYMHRVTVKSSVRVLDLEPCYDFSDTLKSELQTAVVNMMGMTGIYDASAINITQMSSAEFIGKIEDLNEKYDMIYLGARVGKMNTENGVTVYNDPQMKGLIYSHVGDYYDYATKTDTENVTQARETYNARHRLQDSSLNHSKTNDDDSTNKSEDVYRGPGNDMNSTRYEEFCQFIKAGYPVVIADTFIKYGDDKIPVASTATLDKNSYFYKLVQFALTKDENGQYLYWQKNIFTESQLTDNTADTQLGTTLSARRSVFCNYLNLSKLSVNWVTTYGAAYPQELKYNSNQNGASNGGSLEKIDGKYQLQYIFNLQNDAAISQTGTTYDCKLFVDKNADGRFSGSDYVEGKTYTSSEEVSGLTVYIRKGDEWNKVDPIATANGNRYELRTGETYRVIRALPEEYVGVIPWKLVFYDNADRLVRTAKSGYTSVPQQSGKKTIRVLQLLSDDNRNNWNLHDEQNNSNSTFSKCINGLTDWNVVGLDQVNWDGTVTPSKSIDSMTVTYLVNEKLKIGGTSDTDIQKIYQESYNLFQQYDMLILGFGDAYRFGYTYSASDISNNKLDNVKRNLAVGWAVRDYIESGKSILFTHDTTSYVNNIQSAIQWNDQGYKEDQKNYWYWGYEFNKTIRASVGLDRYGALKEYYQQRAASTTGEEQKRDQEYLKTLESYTFDEIKEPNSDNELWQKEGVTKYTVVRFLRSYLEDLRKTGSSEVWFPVKNSLLKQAGYDGGDPRWNYPSSLLMGDYAGSSLIATQVNDGQITQYPYQISADEQLEISNTHYQWLQPNMELDRNGDGKNDIVVWYCISGVADGNYKNTNIYNITPNDVVNNYYIYTMGNVTYSGAGHSTPSKESEIKLFVNTMIAAYNAGVTAPSVRFKDKSGSKIQSVYMLYDPVNHIVLDDKNNGTISVNFQADDYNILAGGQQLCVEFYKSCADDTSGAISVDGITGKVLRLKTDGEDGLKITDSNGNVILPIERNGVKNCYPITNGATYTLKYSSDEMGLFSTDTSGTILNEGAQASTIYARVYTVYDSGSKVTPCGIAELSISAQELFELD